MLKVLRERDPFEFLHRFVFRGYRQEIRAVGFKLFPEQIRLSYMPSLIEAFAADADLRFVHILRANHLRVLLSLKLARSTAHWASRGDGHPPDTRVTVEREELEAFSRQRSADEAMVRERFRGSSLYEVEYTELVRDLPRVLNEIEDHLGIARVSIEPVLQKQTTGPLQERIINYERLRADMIGTEYSAFFDE
jgi:LPS sulfotransferase NodH